MLHNEDSCYALNNIYDTFWLVLPLKCEFFLTLCQGRNMSQTDKPQMSHQKSKLELLEESLSSIIDDLSFSTESHSGAILGTQQHFSISTYPLLLSFVCLPQYVFQSVSKQKI